MFDKKQSASELKSLLLFQTRKVYDVSSGKIKVKGRLKPKLLIPCIHLDFQKMDAEKLFTEFWDWRQKRTPEFSTFTGGKLYNDVLESWTEKRFEEDRVTCQCFLDKATALLASTDSPEVRQNLEFFISEVTIYHDGLAHGGFYFPLNYMEGAHVDFQRLAEWACPVTVKDFQDVVSRYNKFPEYVTDVMTIMRAGAAKGMASHPVSMKGVAENCRKLAASPAQESDFYQPFKELNIDSEDDKKMLQESALEAIDKNIKPTFHSLAEFLETEYLKLCRPEIAATSLPNGQEFYKACLKFHTTTDLTAQEIHNLGLEEVKRIETEMREIIKQLGLEMTLKDFIEKLRDDKTHYFNSPDELLEAGQDIVFNKIYPRLSQIFTSVPRTKLEINSTPSGEYPAGFYLAGTEDGSRPARYSLNTFKFDSQPKYDMISLSLHEACPGHHLQGSYLLEKTGVPQFR